MPVRTTPLELCSSEGAMGGALKKGHRTTVEFIEPCSEINPPAEAIGQRGNKRNAIRLD